MVIDEISRPRAPSVGGGLQTPASPSGSEDPELRRWTPDTAYVPTNIRQATLVDLLDRALDKGVVISADLVVSLAGVPLIGVNLRAAVAGMETMLRYGLMRDLDESIREWESKRSEQRESHTAIERLEAQHAPPLQRQPEVVAARYAPASKEVAAWSSTSTKAT
jgi:hypothetical protein